MATITSVTGKKPRTVKYDLKQQVQKLRNLNEPELRYIFSNGRKFYESPKSTTGPYTS